MQYEVNLFSAGQFILGPSLTVLIEQCSKHILSPVRSNGIILQALDGARMPDQHGIPSLVFIEPASNFDRLARILFEFGK
jgi:hypothetical protein